MGKTVEEICNLLVINSLKKDLNLKSEHTLSSAFAYTGNSSLSGFTGLYSQDNIYEIKLHKLIQELALAIDINSVDKIKYLKRKYGENKEFKTAKKLLNQKCKEIWSVYQPLNNVPKEAMKCLGISNQPELGFLLDNSLKNYEQNNSDTTAYIISNILNNKNMDYSIEEIHSYLIAKFKKEDCKINLKTVEYLIKTHNYDKNKLMELGISSHHLKLSLKIRLWINNLKSKLSYNKI